MDMDYISREKMCPDTNQALTSDGWDFDINWKNYSGYKPDMTVFKSRILSIGGVDITLASTLLTIHVRGFTMHQPGKTDNHPGALTFQFQDFDDMKMTTFLFDYQLRYDSLANHVGLRRKELAFDLTVWRLNNERKRVWQWNYLNCFLQTTNEQNTMDDAKSALQSGSFTVQPEFGLPSPQNLGFQI